MCNLIDVFKLHSLVWTHKVEIEDGIQKLFEWYKESKSCYIGDCRFVVI